MAKRGAKRGAKPDAKPEAKRGAKRSAIKKQTPPAKRKTLSAAVAIDSLDPILVALQARLTAAIIDDTLTLDTTSLGDVGGDIVTLFNDVLGNASVTVSGNVAVTTNGLYLKLIADALQTPIAGIEQHRVVAQFGVASAKLTLQLTAFGGSAWTFGSSFPQLSASWAGLIGFVAADDDDTSIVLSTQAGPRIGGDGSVAKGLTFDGKLSMASGSGPQQALTLLAPGVPAQLAVSGPAVVTGIYEELAVLGGDQGYLPDFSITLPFVGPIEFKNPQAGFAARIGSPPGSTPQAPTGDVYDAWVEAQADIGMGGPTIPLMMRVPYTDTSGWTFGLSPGRSVAISQLSGFLGSFTGLDLFAALPEAVQPLGKFELRSLRLDLNHDFSSYSRLGIEFGTPTADANSNDWTIIAGAAPSDPAILRLTDLSVALAVQKVGSDNQISGRLTGAVAIANTLNLSAQIPLPLGSNNWLFSAYTSQSLPNLADVAQFLGGRSLAALVPDTLAAITTFDLTGLLLSYNPATSKLDRFAIGIAAGADWVIVENRLTIANVQLSAQVLDPMAAGSALTGSVGGSIILGSAATLDVLVEKDDPAGHWMFSVTTEKIALPTLADLATLAGGDVSALLPDTLATAQFDLSNIALVADVTARKVQKFGFALSTQTPWTVISDILVVNAVGIFLDLDWTGTGGARQTSGAIWGDVSFCDGEFWLQAAYASSQWTLSVTLMPDSSLTLKALADAFDAALWPALQTLHIPNIALTSADISYATGSGDYHFIGAIAPAATDSWQIPLGIANIDIIGLGAAVTCTRGQNGAAQDKKVMVTGKFAVGGASFTTSYLAGGPVTIDCALVGTTPVSAYDMVKAICSPGAEDVSWTAEFSSLQSITISNVSAKLTLATDWSFELSGEVKVDGTDVAAMLVVKKIAQKWEFALAIKVSSSWSLSGFTDVFDAFNLDKQDWMVAASSFDSNDFNFPPAFNAPEIHRIDRGLDFYASLQTGGNANQSIAAVTQILPAGAVSPSLVVHGLLADPLANSYIEVAITAPAEGLAMFGSDNIRLAEFDFRLTAVPSVVLRGDFIFRTIHNPDGSYFHLIVDLGITPTSVAIAFEQQPNLGAIFVWENAFGLNQLTVKLLKLALGIGWAPLNIDGTFGGEVDFEHDGTPPTNTVRPNEIPHPHSVARAHRTRVAMIMEAPHREDELMALDLSAPIDQDGIVVMMGTSIMVVAGTPPVPYPYMLEATLINFTLPYILKRFLAIDIPAIMSPINFPLVKFHIELPDPAKPGSMTNLKFNFDGQIEIFGLHGEIKAAFDPSHVMFSASMDPIKFSLGSTTLIAISQSESVTDKGPMLTIDSAGNPSIQGDFYVDFFDILTFSGHILLVDAATPASTRFQFDIHGAVAGLADFQAHLIYQNTNYLDASGSFTLALTTDSLSGFAVGGTKVANGIDLSKGNNGAGLTIATAMHMLLDATSPTDPKYSMSLSGEFHLKITDLCQFNLTLPGFDIDVNKDTFAQIPLKIAGQIASNGASIFASVFTGGAGCFIEFLKIGFFILEEAAEVAKVLDKVFSTGIDVGTKFLSDLGKAADDVADALWNIFGSHDSKKNTVAMKNADYSSDDTAKAIKQAADQGGGPAYTANDLVHDQASAGYHCPQVAGGLVSAFANYADQPLAAGQLFANATLTSFDSVEVAAGLYSQYPVHVSTATKMAAMLNQIYTGANTLSAQQMANAMAPHFPAADVAAALHTHYPSDVDTAGKMAAILTTAYQAAAKPVAAADMAAALAAFFPAPAVAIVLHSDYAADTDTADKLAVLLKTAYTAAPLTAQDMANALAPVFAVPADIVTALKTLYAPDSATAAKMGALLKAAYPAINVGAMAAALAKGQYPALDIATVLKQYFGTDAGTPAQMTALLAAQSYTPADVAPVLKALWPQEAGTAAEVAGFLIGGFPAGSITVAQMASALKTGPFNPVETAPALKTRYAAETDTASKMATLLIAAWINGQANTIALAVMAGALRAAPYAAAGTGGAGAALKADYASDLTSALAMAKTLQTATFALADIATALAELYPTEVSSAPTLAGVLSKVPYEAIAVAPVLKAQYAAALGTSEQMYVVLFGAYPSLTAAQMTAALAASPYAIVDTAPVLSAHFQSAVTKAADMYALLAPAYPGATLADMAAALAQSHYTASDVSPVLRAHYAADTDTAPKLAAALTTAYPAGTIDLPTMSGALVVALFAALDIAPAVHTIYSPTPKALGEGLVAGLASTQPLTALPLGVAAGHAGLNAGDVTSAVIGGLPTTSAGLTAAMLQIVEDSALAAALTTSATQKAAGKTLAQAAAALSGSDAKLMTAALGSVYAPPGPALADLANAVAKTAGVAGLDAVATGILVQFPATQFGALWDGVDSAYKAAGTTLTDSQLAAACAAAFAYIGAAFSQAALVKAMVAKSPSTTLASAAAILVATFAAAATPATMLAALNQGFAGTATLADPRTSSVAVTAALAIPANQADKMAEPLAIAFGLTQCPQNVGALAVALWKSGFSLNASSAALSAYFGSAWSGAAFQVVGSVYAKPEWGKAVDERTAGTAIAPAAQAVHNVASSDAALTVAVLVAVYDLPVAADAAAPMGTVMKGVTAAAGSPAYTLNEASAAMAGQYGADWTVGDYAAFAKAFNK